LQNRCQKWRKEAVANDKFISALLTILVHLAIRAHPHRMTASTRLATPSSGAMPRPSWASASARRAYRGPARIRRLLARDVNSVN